MTATVDVIVVNFNAGEALTQCVRSALDQGPEVRLTVIDNASSDNSIATLRTVVSANDRLKIMESTENPGFAAAVNTVARTLRSSHQADAGHADCILVLNPDCELQAGALQHMQAELVAHPQAALAAPTVVDKQGKVLKGTWRDFPTPWNSLMSFTGLWRLSRRFPSFRGVDHSQHPPSRVSLAQAVSGACMLIRKEVFFELGGMDEAYGLHCEDLDLMYRLQQAGHDCLFVPQARAVHQQGVSSRSRPLWVHWQKHRGMQRFFRKFQASDRSLPVRGLVLAGIWARFALTAPLAILRR